MLVRRPLTSAHASADAGFAAAAQSVVAGEDARLYEHWGLDPGAMADAARDATGARKRFRGASTLTQQLIKNLFFTTHGNPVRQGGRMDTRARGRLHPW